jgi:hypothetical protein
MIMGGSAQSEQTADFGLGRAGLDTTDTADTADTAVPTKWSRTSGERRVRGAVTPHTGPPKEGR